MNALSDHLLYIFLRDRDELKGVLRYLGVPRPGILNHTDCFSPPEICSEIASTLLEYYPSKIPMLTKDPAILSLIPSNTFDWSMAPQSIGADCHGKVRTTVTRSGPDIIHLHSKILPIMNFYHTAVVYKDSFVSGKEKRKAKDMIVLDYAIHPGFSEKEVEAKLLRSLDEDIDLADVNILIEPIF